MLWVEVSRSCRRRRGGWRRCSSTCPPPHRHLPWLASLLCFMATQTAHSAAAQRHRRLPAAPWPGLHLVLQPRADQAEGGVDAVQGSPPDWCHCCPNAWLSCTGEPQCCWLDCSTCGVAACSAAGVETQAAALPMCRALMRGFGAASSRCQRTCPPCSGTCGPCHAQQCSMQRLQCRVGVHVGVPPLLSGCSLCARCTSALPACTCRNVYDYDGCREPGTCTAPLLSVIRHASHFDVLVPSLNRHFEPHSLPCAM